MNSFQVLVSTIFDADPRYPGSTPPKNMWNGAQELWIHGAKWLSTLLVAWSGLWPHVKVWSLAFVSQSGRKFPKCVRAIEWLGKWAFLDVYFVVLVTLAFSLPNVRGCLLIACTDIGWIQAVPRAGLYLFALGAVASQALSAVVARSLWYNVHDSLHDSTKKYKVEDDDIKEKRVVSVKTQIVSYMMRRGMSRNAARDRTRAICAGVGVVFVTVLSISFCWTQTATLFEVDFSTSMSSMAELPGPAVYSVLSVWKHLLTGMPHFTNSAPLFGPALVLLCALCVTTLPLVRLMMLAWLCLFARTSMPSLRRAIAQTEQILSGWCHTSVFAVALLLLAFEIEFLSRQLNTGSIVGSALGSLGKSSVDTAGSGLMAIGMNVVQALGDDVLGEANDGLLVVRVHPSYAVLFALIVVGVLCDTSASVVRWTTDDPDVIEESESIDGTINGVDTPTHAWASDSEIQSAQKQPLLHRHADLGGDGQENKQGNDENTGISRAIGASAVVETAEV